MEEQIANESEGLNIDQAAEAEATELQYNESTGNSLLNRQPQEQAKTNEQQSESTRPDYWPEEYWDGEKNEPKLKEFQEKFAKTEKSVEDLRRIISQKGAEKSSNKVEIPEAYEFEAVTEDFKGDKHGVELFSAAAKDAKLSNEQANIILNKFVEGQEARAQERMQAEIEKLGAEGEAVLTGINNFINARVQNKTFTPEEGEAFANLVTDANAARALSKVISMTGEMAIPTSVRMSSDHKSPADIKQAMIEAYRSKDGRLSPNMDSPEVRKLREELNRFN